MENTNEFEVDGRLVTDVGGTLGFEVLSTPAMVAMMERTASMMVYPHLPAGKATVGFEICVKHVARPRRAPRAPLGHGSRRSATDASCASASRSSPMTAARSASARTTAVIDARRS